MSLVSVVPVDDDIVVDIVSLMLRLLLSFGW
jgi:hypothetical protein